MYPILFRVGGFNVYAYGFFLMVAILAGGILSMRRLKRGALDIPAERMIDLFFYSILSAMLGARILFVVINFDAYRENPLAILKIWEGGLVFYGGLISAFGVAIGYMLRHRLPVWKLADLAAPSLALGLFFGRIGCFLAGCCYGKETSRPWGVVFTDPNSLAALNVSLHPTQLYEAGAALSILLFLAGGEKKKSFDGRTFWLFLLLYSIVRFLIEIWRGDPRGFLLGGLLSTSQGIGVLLAILSLFMLSFLSKRNRRSGRCLFWRS
jgi:phosphatidylglycerol:prolipoprotein diacylglycerol transferase